ncbi:prenyltransferase [Chlamydiota bacterium]
MKTNYPKICYFLRALRVPFLSASVLPFMFGSFLERTQFSLLIFVMGLFSVIFIHLGANLINDYSDSRTGADWKDCTYYGFFGGSKLIQENVYSEFFYLVTALVCFVIGGGGVLIITLVRNDFRILIYFLFIVFFAWNYSEWPLKCAYHGYGEFVLFILFGPVLVMGGYFLQTNIFPDIKSFLASIPCGLVTVILLVVNEIPDYKEDILTDKRNWISLVKAKNGYLLVCCLVIGLYCAVTVCVFFQIVGLVSLLSFLLLGILLRIIYLLKKQYSHKAQLITASKDTILFHFLFLLFMILGTFL